MSLKPLVQILSAAVLAVVCGAAAAVELPVVDGAPVVATVNDEPVFLKDLEREIGMLHAVQEGGDRKAAKQNPAKILDRMVTARLLSQEARNIGLDELPETEKEFDRIQLETLRDLYSREILKQVKADPATTQRMYRDAIAEYRLRSILLPKEPDLKEVQAKLKAGAAFDAVVADVVKSGKGSEGSGQNWLKASQMQVPVVQAVRKLRVGEVGPPLQVDAGWTVFRLIEARYPDDADAKAQIAALALNEARDDKMAAHLESLRKKWTVEDTKLFDTLDLDKEGAFEAARKDARPLVRIQGGAPLTVADLAVGLEKRFFHGIDKAISAKRLNAEKRGVLNDLVNRRIVVQDARRLGIDTTKEYRVVNERKRNAYLFGAMVEKVVVPEVKMEYADLEAYLEEHRSEFMSPAMIAAEALAFDQRKGADDALGKLQRGADFAWLKANTPGQTPKTTKNLLEFAPGLVVESVLPEGARKALAGAGPGDYRFYGEGEGPFYVIHVLRREAAKPTPLADIQEKVAKLVYQEKLSARIDDWGTKLRKASEIKTFATGEQLLELVMRDMTGGD